LAERRIVRSTFWCAVLVVATAQVWSTDQPARPSHSAERSGAPALAGDSGAPRIGGPFSLTDQQGHSVDETLLMGHYSLLFFGFTNCADVCPLSLWTLARALDAAGPVAEQVLPVFITLDPERDTPEVIASYLTKFHTRFVGLTGSARQVAAVARGYRAFYAKVLPKDGSSGYSIEHSGFIFLLDKSGRYVTHFDSDATVQQIASRLQRELMRR